jgi:hypothetical protein
MSSCPISGVPVDEHVARVIGAFVVVFAVAYLIYPWVGWLAILVFDFFARVYHCEWSPFGRAALPIRRRFFPPKLIDSAPKLFAARIGLLMAAAALVLHVGGLPIVAYGVIVLLLSAALLESVLGFCVGCWMYGMRRLFMMR